MWPRNRQILDLQKETMCFVLENNENIFETS